MAFQASPSPEEILALNLRPLQLAMAANGQENVERAKLQYLQAHQAQQGDRDFARRAAEARALLAARQQGDEVIAGINNRAADRRQESAERQTDIRQEGIDRRQTAREESLAARHLADSDREALQKTAEKLAEKGIDLPPRAIINGKPQSDASYRQSLLALQTNYTKESDMAEANRMVGQRDMIDSLTQQLDDEISGQGVNKALVVARVEQQLKSAIKEELQDAEKFPNGKKLLAKLASGKPMDLAEKVQYNALQYRMRTILTAHQAALDLQSNPGAQAKVRGLARQIEEQSRLLERWGVENTRAAALARDLQAQRAQRVLAWKPVDDEEERYHRGEALTGGKRFMQGSPPGTGTNGANVTNGQVVIAPPKSAGLFGGFSLDELDAGNAARTATANAKPITPQEVLVAYVARTGRQPPGLQTNAVSPAPVTRALPDYSGYWNSMQRAAAASRTNTIDPNAVLAPVTAPAPRADYSDYWQTIQRAATLPQ